MQRVRGAFGQFIDLPSGREPPVRLRHRHRCRLAAAISVAPTSPPVLRENLRVVLRPHADAVSAPAHGLTSDDAADSVVGTTLYGRRIREWPLAAGSRHETVILREL